MNTNLLRIGLILVFFPLIYLSCQNPSENIKPEENIPVHRIYSNNAEKLISDSEYSIVQDLFQTNNISLSEFQPWFFRRDADSLIEYFVSCNQFHKGLQIFSSYAVLWFNNQKILCNRTGKLYTGMMIDTLPKVSMEKAGQYFYDRISSDSLFRNSSRYYNYKELNAELGFYDTEMGVDSSKKCVLCWKLNFLNNDEYPVAIILADSLAFLAYSVKAPTR